LLPETYAAGAMDLAERLRSMFRLADHGPVELTVSIGVSSFHRTTITWEQMPSKADDAVYRLNAPVRIGRRIMVTSVLRSQAVTW
jgi:GGDEF domain-containing protein